MKIVKKFAALFLLVLLVAAAVLPVSAAYTGDDGRYISELAFAEAAETGGASAWLSNNEYLPAWTESGGDFLCVGYRTTYKATEAITGIAAFYGQAGTQRNINGVAYSAVGGYSVGEKKWYAAMDLSVSGGDDCVYIYITKDSRAGTSITDIALDETKNPDGWFTVCRDGGTAAAELFGAADGKSLYIHYRRSPDYTGTAFSGPTVFVIMGGTTLIVVTAVLCAVVRRKKAK